MSGEVILFKGDDRTLLTDQLKARIDVLVGDGDRSLLVDEFDGDDYQLSELVDAARTPPFFGDKRIIVGRAVERFSSAESVEPLVQYLADPSPTTTVVLGWVSGRVPKRLSEAMKAAGAKTVDAGKPRSGRALKEWIDDHLKASPVELDAGARTILGERIGQDVGRLVSVLSTFESTFGAGTKLSASDIEPFLGGLGSVPPWELTDAIDRGNIPTALERLGRMLDAGDMHELQVMRTLERHFTQMLRLDGAQIAGDKGAAEQLGIAPFTAKKLLSQLRRLGSARVGDAIVLLGDADLDLRGATAIPSRTVIEVLVARLARLSR